MIIFDYNNILLRYDRIILSYAKRINYLDFEDYGQEIRIYIFQNLYRFNISISTINFYILLLIKTCYRKLVFDKKKQQLFEEGFYLINDNVSLNKQEDRYSFILLKILQSLENKEQIGVFFSIIFDTENRSGYKISKRLNMNYQKYLQCIKRIKETTKNIS